MSESVHPDIAVLIRCLDGELEAQELNQVQTHLESCAQCREQQQAYEALSNELDTALSAVPVAATWQERASLVRAMTESRAKSNAGRVLWRFGWGMAVAATLALALLLAPGRKIGVPVQSIAVAKRQISSLDVNGETFMALPYSNPELPLNTSHVVEMQVPVSALAEAGIAFEPGTGEAGDRMVPANVLLGIDGQPLGVHILGAAE
jgi:hypothetical protein